MKGLFLILGVMVGFCQVGCGQRVEAEVGEKRVEVSDAKARKIVDAALWQVGKTVSYNPEYVGLKYPGGDIPIEKGVCSDVVIRALRRGLRMDLQKLVHEDMKANFSKYPKRWGLKRTDRSIDHRRVPNLRRLFERKGWERKVSKDAKDYRAGDLVTCTVAGRLPHIMVVSDRVDADGVPFIVHNIGRGVQEEARLFEFPITGVYRVR